MSGYLQRSIADLRPLNPPFRLRRVALSDRKISFGLLLLFIVLIYTSPAELVGLLALLRPAQLVAALALLALCVEMVGNREGLRLVWPNTHFLAGFLWVSGLSCLTAVWARLSVESTLDLAKYAVIYILIVHTVRSEKRVRAVVWTMVAAGLFPGLGALRNFLSGIVHEGERVHWVGIFANSNDLAYSMVLLVPLALALAPAVRRWKRPLLWGAIAVYVATVFVTYSRGSMVGLFAVLLLAGLRHKGPMLRLATVGMMAATVIFAAYFWSRQEGFTNLSDFTLRQRLITIETGIDMFLDRPLLGVGLGGSVAAFPYYAPAGLQFTKSLVIHNTFVQALSEVGLIGCALFVAFIASGMIFARGRSAAMARAGDRHMAGIADAIHISLWGFIVCGLFGPYLLSWFPYMLAALAAALHGLAQADTGSAAAAHESAGV